MLPRQYAKLCDIRDFDDPRLLDTVRSIIPDRDPLTHIERKVWEFAMLAMFLEDVGRLDDRSEVLAIGAGDERIAFWLANRAGHVLATDIYGSGTFVGQEADVTMLEDPASRAPFPYREDRLEVRWMDARDLTLEDESVDVVYSLSSIEHLIHRADIRRAAAEMGRVLRPGGHAVLITDCFVRLHPLDIVPAPLSFLIRIATLGRKRWHVTVGRPEALAQVFSPRELDRCIVRPSGLRLMQPLRLGVSQATWENFTIYEPGPEVSNPILRSRTGDFYPHLLLGRQRSAWTSVCLVLEKQTGRG